MAGPYSSLPLPSFCLYPPLPMKRHRIHSLVHTRALTLLPFPELRGSLIQATKGSFAPAFMGSCRAPWHSVASQRPQVGGTHQFLEFHLLRQYVHDWQAEPGTQPFILSLTHSFFCFPSLTTLRLNFTQVIILWIQKVWESGLWFQIK